MRISLTLPFSYAPERCYEGRDQKKNEELVGVFAYFVSRAVLTGLFEGWPERMRLVVVIGKDEDGGISAENRMVLFHDSQADGILARLARDAECDISDVLVAPVAPDLPDGVVVSTWEPGPGDEKWILGQVRGRRSLEEEAIDLGLTIEFAQSEGIDPSKLMSAPQEEAEIKDRPSWKTALEGIGSLLPAPTPEPPKLSAVPRPLRVEPPVVSSPAAYVPPTVTPPPAAPSAPLAVTVEEDVEEPEVLGYFSPSPDVLSNCRLGLGKIRSMAGDILLEVPDAQGNQVPETLAPLATMIGEDLCSFLLPPGLGRDWRPDMGLTMRVPAGMLPPGYADAITEESVLRIASTPWAVHFRILETPARMVIPSPPEKEPAAKRHILRSATIGALLGLAVIGAAAGVAWVRPGEAQVFLEKVSDFLGISKDWVGRAMARIT